MNGDSSSLFPYYTKRYMERGSSPVVLPRSTAARVRAAAHVLTDESLPSSLETRVAFLRSRGLSGSLILAAAAREGVMLPSAVRAMLEDDLETEGGGRGGSEAVERAAREALGEERRASGSMWPSLGTTVAIAATGIAAGVLLRHTVEENVPRERMDEWTSAAHEVSARAMMEARKWRAEMDELSSKAAAAVQAWFTERMHAGDGGGVVASEAMSELVQTLQRVSPERSVGLGDRVERVERLLASRSTPLASASAADPVAMLGRRGGGALATQQQQTLLSHAVRGLALGPNLQSPTSPIPTVREDDVHPAEAPPASSVSSSHLSWPSAAGELPPPPPALSEEVAEPIRSAVEHVRASNAPKALADGARVLVQHLRLMASNPALSKRHRIPLASKDFRSAVQPLAGHERLLQALGFAPPSLEDPSSSTSTAGTGGSAALAWTWQWADRDPTANMHALNYGGLLLSIAGGLLARDVQERMLPLLGVRPASQPLHATHETHATHAAPVATAAETPSVAPPASHLSLTQVQEAIEAGTQLPGIRTDISDALAPSADGAHGAGDHQAPAESVEEQRA
jgi:hypothetical protein